MGKVRAGKQHASAMRSRRLLIVIKRDDFTHFIQSGSDGSIR